MNHAQPSADDEPTIKLTRWTEPLRDDDRHANFKAEVQTYCLRDPLVTIRGVSDDLDIPMGAIARFVLAKWATGGSGGLLELGPVMTRQLWEPIAAAERQDSDEHRLAAYHQLRQLISSLNAMTVQPS